MLKNRLSTFTLKTTCSIKCGTTVVWRFIVPGLLFCFIWGTPVSYAQSLEMITVEGLVTDKKGETLPGVYVTLVKSIHGTVTDRDGRYALLIPKNSVPETKIKFSLIGMKTVEVSYNNRTHINVKMAEDEVALQEVVVTGVYNLPRRDMVGSFTTLKADSIMMPAFRSIDEMLQGHVSGMIVKMPMRAGAAPEISIRGQSTLLGSTAPLWVVDGVIQPDMQAVSGVWDSWNTDNGVEINNIIGSQISWLNPTDIESITVLKDASATAVYGSRASNGVIVITTKKGSADRLSINVSTNLTIGEQLNYGLYNLMNSQERINFSKEAFEAGVHYQNVPFSQLYTYEGMYNMFLSGKLTEEEFARQYNYLETTNTNWLKYLTRPSVNRSHNVSVSGGTSKVTYTASMSYNKQDATEAGNGSERYTGRLSVGVDLTPKIRVDAALSTSLNKTTGFAGAGIDPIGYATTTSRAIPAYNPDGSPVFYTVRRNYKYNSNTVEQGLPYNITDDMANTGSTVENPTIQASLDFKWKLTPDLTFQTVGGYNVNNRMSEAWMGENSFHIIEGYRGYRIGSPEAADPRYKASAILKNGGILITDNSYSRNYSVRNQLNYSHTFADIHRLNLMAMWEVNSTYRNSKYNTVFGYDKSRGERIDAPTVPSELIPIGSQQGPRDYVETYNQYEKGFWRSTNFTDNKASLAFIAAYSFNEKYVINANFRNDWSNTFGQNANKRFNPAYSVGVSWKLAEEPFMDWADSWLSTSDFRLTYGTQGNVSSAQTTEMILRYMPIHSMLGEPYSIISRIANPYMTWERTENWNGGLDLALFKRKVTLVIDGYTRLSNVGRSFNDTPENGGFTSTLTGTFVRNSGIEGTINVNLLQTSSWRASIGANFSKNWNLIVREEQTDAISYNTTTYLRGATDKIIVPGYPLGAFWAYPYAGPNPENGIPTFDFGTSTNYTDFLKYAGTRISSIGGGVNLRAGYKGVSLAILCAATLGGNTFLSNPYTPFVNGRMPDPTLNLSKELLNRWQQPGDASNFPGLYIVNDETRYPVWLSDPTNAPTRNRYSMWGLSDDRVASISTFRCRSIQITWNIPGSLLREAHIRTVNVTAAVNNVFLIADSKWNGMDPELGGDRKAPRSYTMGINIGF
ncbi:MAG: TonB-dependent receptor SusC [Candidatus Ordinivivax streblomastigis]|uniref:TonB-dependent receptor SusC n=1 Tax=Candidatus Ordinivivax streblomastigis TaxID=2540710 RepID=A0A5M8NTZ8_9BACT|nr:MAG: TonB-dependent receptor SusC [Candidatus Ordinivivax streblomastigis]